MSTKPGRPCPSLQKRNSNQGQWPEFDPEVLGGHYTGHHGAGARTTISVATNATEHPILRGVDATRLLANGSLYKVSPLAESAAPLLIGTIPDQPSEPV